MIRGTGLFHRATCLVVALATCMGGSSPMHGTVEFGGLIHTALGRASTFIRTVGGETSLVVANIGMSGNDGVRITHGQEIMSWSATFDQSNPELFNPQGSLKISSFLEGDNPEEHSTFRVTIERNNNSLMITPAMDLNGDVKTRYDAVRDTSTIGSTTTTNAHEVIRICSWRGQKEMLQSGICDPGVTFPYMVAFEAATIITDPALLISWSNPVVIVMPGGKSLVGDALKISRAISGTEYYYISRITVQAKGFSSFTITRETALW